jgi:hypothetical protein
LAASVQMASIVERNWRMLVTVNPMLRIIIAIAFVIINLNYLDVYNYIKNEEGNLTRKLQFKKPYL